MILDSVKVVPLKDDSIKTGSKPDLFGNPLRIQGGFGDRPREGSLRACLKTILFAQFQRQPGILILEMLHVFLRLKFRASLTLNKNGRFKTSS